MDDEEQDFGENSYDDAASDLVADEEDLDSRESYDSTDDPSDHSDDGPEPAKAGKSEQPEESGKPDELDGYRRGALSSDDGQAETPVAEFLKGTGAPEKYGDFLYPEGVDPDDLGIELVGALEDEFRNRGYSQDEAQAYLDDAHMIQSVLAHRHEQNYQKAVDSWWEATSAAGLNTPQVRNNVRAAMEHYDPQGVLTPMVKSFRLDQNPAFVLMASELGKGLAKSAGTAPVRQGRPRSASSVDNEDHYDRAADELIGDL